jgi:phosphoglycerate kinase
MQEELQALGRALEHPDRPVVAIVGGAKVSTKIQLLENLVTKVDALVIGGGMANTFLHAMGTEIGRSLCEKDQAETAKAISAKADESGCAIVLPLDAVVADALKPGVATETVSIDRVPADKMILDVGPKTIDAVAERLVQSKTLVWNGPLGAFETAPFDEATVAVAKRVAELTGNGKLVSVAGGGDTVAALAHAGVEDGLTYVSTAGGAFLEWLEGRELPGVAALKRR